MNWQIIVGIILLIGGIGNVASDFGVFLFGVLVGSALLYYGLYRKGIVKSPLAKLFPGKFSEKPPLKKETFYLTGVSYYEKNILKLVETNPMWSFSPDQIRSKGLDCNIVYRYRYTVKPVQLVEEPKNPNDKNAVAAYMSGQLIGYIKREDNAHIKHVKNHSTVKSISGHITGGEYKIIYDDGNMEHNSKSFSVKIEIEYI